MCTRDDQDLGVEVLGTLCFYSDVVPQYLEQTLKTRTQHERHSSGFVTYVDTVDRQITLNVYHIIPVYSSVT